MGHSAEYLISAGRLVATRRAPYFRDVLLALVPTEANDLVETMGVTLGLLLVFNRSWVEKLTTEEAGGVVWHEAMHVILDHGRRRGDRHPILWNIAGDIFINDQGRKGGFTLPKGGLFPEMFGLPENLTADDYYARLMKKAEEDAAGGGEGVDGMEGQAQAKSEAAGGKWKWEGCGSGAGNPFENEPDGKPDSGARSETEANQARAAVARAVSEHAQANQGRGNLPLGLDVWANAQLEPPRVPWQSLLARAVRTAIAYRPGAVDYRFAKPSRRQGGIGFGAGVPILPALVAPVPNVAFVLDTSGSMYGAPLAEGVNEAIGVLRAVGADITFCAADAAVHELKKVRSPMELIKLVKGGGGTDFGPAFRALERARPQPEVVIFATDGDGACPTVPPPFKVVWLLIDHYRDPAAWGDKIVVSTRDRAKKGR